MTLSDFLARLSHPSRTGSGYVAFCPAHRDVNNKSLSVSQGDKGILVKCFAGCSVEKIVDAVGLSVKDLFAEPLASRTERVLGRAPKQSSRQPASPLTLAQLAAAKKLPEAFLYDLGVENHPDGIGVVVGYFDVNGRQHARFRLRTALSAKDGSQMARAEGCGTRAVWNLEIR